MKRAIFQNKSDRAGGGAARGGNRHKPTPWWRVAFALVLATPLWATSASGPTEYQLKAAFLFNFVKFTEWPSSAFTNATAPLVIGVLGNDPFGGTLDDLVKGETVNRRPIVTKRFPSGAEAFDCHVLFISRSEQDRLPQVLKAMQGRPVLMVSDLDQFGQRGGMINLALSAAGTVKPEINPEAARAAGVPISSKLLNLPSVRLVKTEN